CLQPTAVFVARSPTIPKVSPVNVPKSCPLNPRLNVVDRMFQVRVRAGVWKSWSGNEIPIHGLRGLSNTGERDDGIRGGRGSVETGHDPNSLLIVFPECLVEQLDGRQDPKLTPLNSSHA